MCIRDSQNTQTEQINTFLQQGVDVLVINPVQTTSAQTIVDTINPSETPIVFINREPDKSVLDSYADKCCYVGADARQSGTYQGELILETETQGDINGDGKITYIMCKGDPENIDAQYRTEYSIKALTDAGKEVGMYLSAGSIRRIRSPDIHKKSYCNRPSACPYGVS